MESPNKTFLLKLKNLNLLNRLPIIKNIKINEKFISKEKSKIT